MTINDSKLGKCYVEISVDRFSSVDSYIESGYSDTLDRELTDIELDYLTENHGDVIQQYSWENGSLNHN